MKNKELIFDRKKHILYSKHGERVIRAWLVKHYGRNKAERLWERVQRQYAAYLAEAPDVGGKRNTHARGIYDGMLFFSFYTVLPEKPSLKELQPLTAELFMADFKRLGGLFNLNRRFPMWLAEKIFRFTSEKDKKLIAKYPAGFCMKYEPFDKKAGAVRYCFTQCPNAEFAKAHGLSHVMPLLCNCDYIGMQYLHAGLIRQGTLMQGDRCDYLIVGDKNPLLKEYTRTVDEQGFWLNRKGEALK